MNKDEPALFWINIDNFSELVTLFPRSELIPVVDQLKARLASLPGCSVGEVKIRGMSARLSVIRATEGQLLTCYEVLRYVGGNVYPCGTEFVVLALSAHYNTENLVHLRMDLKLRRSSQRLGSKAGRERWFDDMRIAVAVYQAIEQKRLSLLYQPIATSPGSKKVLYHECLIRIVRRSGEGAVLRPEEFTPALERLGLTRFIDCVVVEDVLALLWCDPNVCLSCKVSAMSIVNGPWWQGVTQLLYCNPHLAGRLIIEITWKSTFPFSFRAWPFVQQLQLLGCRIAVVDFSVGLGAAQIVARNGYDIVKVTTSFLMASSGREIVPQFVASLCKITSFLSPYVILEDVSESEHFEFALLAGIRWFQGSYIKPPSLTLHDDGQKDILISEDFINEKTKFK